MTAENTYTWHTEMVYMEEISQLLRDVGISLPSPLLLTIQFTEKLIVLYSNPAGGIPPRTMEMPASRWMVIVAFFVGAGRLLFVCGQIPVEICRNTKRPLADRSTGNNRRSLRFLLQCRCCLKDRENACKPFASFLKHEVSNRRLK